MSCCPSAPSIIVAQDSPPIDGPEQELRVGETIECFSKRAGNSTGAHDDAVMARKNTIFNESLPVSKTATTNVKFKLTSSSDATGIVWSKSGDATPGVTLVGDTLSGTFNPSTYGKKLTITITATFNSTTDDNGAPKTSDSRTYNISPSILKKSDSIQFLTPLVGGMINSPFGMRFHPIQKVNKLHTGMDMVLSTKGVNGDIIAVADGEVIKARNTDPNGYGNSIHIKHTNSSGIHLCTSTYNHLFKMLVTEGQKVSAGQKIALEGGAKGVPGSGGSSGLHLHFECKLPDGSFTDPAPYLRGPIQIAGNQLSSGNPDTSTVSTQAAPGAAVNESDVAAKQGCPKSAVYPQNPDKPEPAAEVAPISSAVDPFELAWFFTMTYEVGPHWPVAAGTTPSDIEIVDGLCDTTSQKRKTGYKNWASESGGETKFGIAKSGNPGTDIKSINYVNTKSLGYSNYWKRGKINPHLLSTVQNAPYLAIFMFDTNYQHGDGNGRTIWNDVNPTGPFSTKASQMPALDALYARRLSFANSLKVESNRKGVARRVTDCYNYVKSLTI
jgi:murein DD-endopeptidase MepM/ murein hydrolase activator NlpD